MSKRNVAAVLWFFAGWVSTGAVFAMAAMPPELGVAVGVVVAALIWWDPVHWIWPKPAAQRRVRPINDLAAELDRAAQGPVAETEHVRR